MIHLKDPAVRGLFRAVLEDPSDDTPRLLLADRLTELGDVLGEWIRHSIREGKDYTKDPIQGTDNLVQLGWIAAHTEFFIGVGYDEEGKENFFQDYRMPRGFVNSVTFYRAVDFLRLAQLVFLSQPVTEIKLLDKSPEDVEGKCWSWHKDVPGNNTESRTVLARCIFDQLPASAGGNSWGCTSEEGAWELLSQACVRYGRALACLPDISGLPPFGLEDTLVGTYQQYAGYVILYCQGRTAEGLVVIRCLENTEMVKRYNEFNLLANWRTISREQAFEQLIAQKWK